MRIDELEKRNSREVIFNMLRCKVIITRGVQFALVNQEGEIITRWCKSPSGGVIAEYENDLAAVRRVQSVLLGGWD